MNEYSYENNRMSHNDVSKVILLPENYDEIQSARQKKLGNLQLGYASLRLPWDFRGWHRFPWVAPISVGGTDFRGWHRFPWVAPISLGVVDLMATIASTTSRKNESSSVEYCGM